jgi:hypothetical protein
VDLIKADVLINPTTSAKSSIIAPMDKRFPEKAKSLLSNAEHRRTYGGSERDTWGSAVPHENQYLKRHVELYHFIPSRS